MYKLSSFILMTALSRGDGWTKRKCPYLSERQSLDGGQEATRRTDLSAILKEFRDHRVARRLSSPALLCRLVNAVRTLSGFSVMRRMRDKVCSSSISLDLIIFLMMQQNDSVLILDRLCKRGEQNADLMVKFTDGRWLL